MSILKIKIFFKKHAHLVQFGLTIPKMSFFVVGLLEIPKIKFKKVTLLSLLFMGHCTAENRY